MTWCEMAEPNMIFLGYDKMFIRFFYRCLFGLWVRRSVWKSPCIDHLAPVGCIDNLRWLPWKLSMLGCHHFGKYMADIFTICQYWGMVVGNGINMNLKDTNKGLKGEYLFSCSCSFFLKKNGKCMVLKLNQTSRLDSHQINLDTLFQFYTMFEASNPKKEPFPSCSWIILVHSVESTVDWTLYI